MNDLDKGLHGPRNCKSPCSDPILHGSHGGGTGRLLPLPNLTEELSMAQDNNRALWDYRIKHLLGARPDSSPEAAKKLVNATAPLMNSLFGKASREWNADKGSDCKLSKWLIQPLIKIFCFFLAPSPLFLFFFLLSHKLHVLLQSSVPFPTSIFTKTTWLFLKSYAPLIIPWKYLKHTKWNCLPTGIQEKQQEFGQHTNFTQSWATLPQMSSLSGAQRFWWVWEPAQLFHRCLIAAYAAFQVSPTHPTGIMGCRAGARHIFSLTHEPGFLHRVLNKLLFFEVRSSFCFW